MNLRLFCLAASAFLTLPMSTPSNAQNAARNKPIDAIRAVLEAQRVAWNKGDIESYMDGYDVSEATVFVSGDKVTHGWKTVLDHYKKSYDTREKMGELSFSELEITMLSNDFAFVIGKWLLKRSYDEPHGRFTLVFKKTKQGWRIIHDHSTTL